MTRCNIINRLNRFLKKIVVYFVYIMIFLIVWECNFAQSFFVFIYWMVFCLWPPTFSFFPLPGQKIIWWLDNLILTRPHCVIFSFVFVNMKSIRVDVLGVTLVGDFINCLRPKVLQNSRYLFFKWYFICAFYYVLIFSSS